MAARQAYYQKALTIARHGLCYAYAYGYGYMHMIIIHCERDRGICTHRINKTCFVTQPRHRHRRLAWLDSGLRLCMTMSMTTTSATSTSTTTTTATATPTHTARVRCLCMHRRSICYAIIYALDIAICHTIT